MQAKLLVGYFPGWSQCDTGRSSVLIYAEDLSATTELENLFLALAKGEVKDVQLHTLDFIEPYGGIEICARLSEVDKAMQKLDDVNSFEWETTSTHWENFADLVSVFRKPQPDTEFWKMFREWGGRGSHQYLDTDVNYGVDVEVSFNEYSEEWFKQAHTGYNA